ncbi:MAG TPA: hypothetical protein DD635_05495 [Flavobacteriales bacterium]|nr:hypothetical protein [Flavobacteriales bacterium]|tara:strand:- start:1386 stop:2309 length:924 start_codon:yes stop_codon:yes gene_type:complete
MRFNQRIQALPLLIGLGVFLATGCGGSQDEHAGHDHGTETEAVGGMDTDGMAVTSRQNTLTKIFHAAPSPIETASLIKRSGANFHKDALNGANRASEYTTSDAQAINLGVYGADLSYATIFEENSTGLEYLAVIKSLSAELGVDDVLSGARIDELEANRNDREMLIDIVSDTFYELNERLKFNGQEDLAGLVVAAGWVEGMYLATRHLEEAPEELKARIAEQKLVLDDVMRLCQSYEQTEALAELLTSMEAIVAAYSDVSTAEGEGTTSREESGSFVIGGGPTFSADNATIEAIASAVETVRSGCIQ